MKKFKRLNRNDRRWKASTLDTYLSGRCCILAVALHRELSEQIVFLMNGSSFVHACTQTPEGRFRDARGVLSRDMVAGNIFNLPESFTVKEVTEREVFSFTDNPGSRFGEREIKEAVRRVRTVWPEWGWKDSFLKRSRAFIADLEKISRKHRLYVHGSLPTTLPILSAAEPDHVPTYVIQEVPIGEHFFIESC